MILKVLAVVFIVFFLILIHEFGHYIVAKRNGVKVHEFAIGFAPFVFSFRKFDTDFKLGLLPLGGYVKLHGEDSSNKKLRADSSSFASKTPWQKTKIICAGVLMNFLVFWVLFTINLTVGADPLVLNQDDFRRHINSPMTTLYHGAYVQDAANKTLLDTKLIESESDSVSSFENEMGAVKQFANIDSLDLDFYPSVSLPVMSILEVENQSPFYSDLKSGDVILKVNNQIVFSDTDLVGLLNSSVYELEVLRGGDIFKVSYSQDKSAQVVTSVVSDSIAASAGVEAGFKLIAIEGVEELYVQNLPMQILEYLSDNNLDSLEYTFVDLDGEILVMDLSPSESGAVGMFLSQTNKSTGLGVSYFFDMQNFSVINKPIEKYAWHLAPFVALHKGFELSKLTAVSISKTFFRIFTSLEVSEDVGGPIQVFKTGYNFVSIGGTALMSFVAMISLTLAVVNILPIPALDGGRLLFVVLEAFRSKPIDPKFESAIHALGFLLLLFLIVTISIFDIIRL